MAGTELLLQGNSRHGCVLTSESPYIYLDYTWNVQQLNKNPHCCRTFHACRASPPTGFGDLKRILIYEDFN